MSNIKVKIQKTNRMTKKYNHDKGSDEPTSMCACDSSPMGESQLCVAVVCDNHFLKSNYTQHESQSCPECGCVLCYC